MGLLICLSAAPWTGVEIDEVNRVGRALADKVGDDAAWFEEWARMGEKIEARGRDALRAGHKLTAASCFMRATRYYQTGERFIHPRSQRSMDVYARSVTAVQGSRRDDPPPAYRAGRGALREHQPAGAAGAS